MNSQTGKYTCPEQSKTGQLHGSVCSEPSEQTHQLGPETVPSEGVEISFSENLTKNVLTEKLGPSPQDLSKSGQAGHSSCAQQITLEQTHGSDSGSLRSEPSEQEHQLGSELVQNKPVETSSALSSCAVNNRWQSSSEYVTNNSLTVQLELPAQDVSKSMETEKGSCSQQITLEQHESDPKGLCCEDIHQLGSELIQTRPVKNSSMVSSCAVNEQLWSPSENLTKNSLTEHLGMPFEDVSKSFQTGKSSSPQQKTSEWIQEFGSGSELSELKHQLGSELVHNEPVGVITTTSSCVEQLQSSSKNVAKNCVAEHLELSSEDVSRSSQTRKSPCPQQTISQQTHEFGSDISESLEEKHHFGSELVKTNEQVETSNVVPSCIVTEQLGPHLEASTETSLIEHLAPPPEDSSMNLGTGQLGLLLEDVTNNSTLEQLETPPKNAIRNSSRLGRRDKITPKSLKKKYMLRSFASDRVLRSRTQEKPKPPESSNNLANVSSAEMKRRKRKKIREKTRIADEFSRIRKHLRYFLNRISYEQSLIDAYSSEGWKGYSLEKLKPEKELQRATSEIFRRKLKIRDLFQRLDSLCDEGKLPDSLFDSDGQICSEDIFCAKCGSKDTSADNDIILCDGACDRGFHQYCLEPPLLNEDIPPDDEGWLCPGCDCKVDCIDLLNDSQGTNISISDCWEKVFPEAAAAAAGHNQDPNFGLSSDDSDDNDYNPDALEDDMVQGDEPSSDESSSNESSFDGSSSDGSSSDGSEYASANEELEAPPNDGQYLGLPSDDSEDDDYDPDALNLDLKDKKESSSSDFTSDSEDLAAALDDNKSSGDDEGPTSTSLDGIRTLRGSSGKRSKVGGKKQSLDDELLSILKSDPGQDGSAPIVGKRHIERLDYKKLHDETYGNISTDSSDDEDWNGTSAPRKRKKTIEEVAPVSPNGNTPIVKSEKSTKDVKHNIKEGDHTPKRGIRQKANVEETNNSPTKSLEGSSKTGSSGKRVKSSTYRRLGEAVTQGLYKSFKENHYPERETKERLAQELGLTFQQVSKWFENARWSFHHSSRMEASRADNASKLDTPSPQTNKKPPEPGPDKVTRDVTCNGAQSEELPKAGSVMPESDQDNELVTQESSRKKITTANSRKRKSRSDNQASDPDMRAEKIPKPPAESPKANEVRSGSGGMKTRSRKSVS